MQIVKGILIVIDIIIALSLIIVTMIQTKEDAGMSGAVTGSSSSNFLEKNKGRTNEGKLKRATIILGISFAISTIALSIIYVM